MTSTTPADPRLRLVVGGALVVLGAPLLLGPVAPVAVLLLALGVYALVPSGSQPAQRWRAPLSAVGAAAAVGTVMLVRAARAL